MSHDVAVRARAAVSDGEGRFEIADVELGAPGPGEVLVELRASGVCHTDWDSLRWGRRLVAGHEGVGVVLTAGSGAFAPGDRVLLNWAMPCGACFQCRRGAENICESKPAVAAERITCDGAPIEPSFGLGTLATHALVPVQAVTPIPPAIEIPFASASFLGCAVMTGYGSVFHAAGVEAGSSVVVLGTGAVGLCVIQAAVAARAAAILAVDVNPERLAMAERFGATAVLQASRDDGGLRRIAAQVREASGGRGADYAFECTAVPELGPAPLAMVRNGGTAVGVSGIEQEIAFDMELFEWDKTYINPLYGQCRPARDFPELLRMYDAGALQLDAMVTRTYALDDLGRAFGDMLAGRNAKGVIVHGGAGA